MWLDRFERFDNNLTLVGLEKSGQAKYLSPSEPYKSRPGNSLSAAITLRTSLCDWERASPREYAAAFDIESDVTEHHETHLILTARTRIVLPAWLLQRAMFGPYYCITEFLYAKNGLEQLCSPILNGNKFSVGLALRKEFGRARNTTELAQRMEWLYAYPTAYRAWNSVYRFASSGRIGFELPSAEVLLSVHGKHAGDTFYAISVDILELNPLERPLEWAKIDRERYVFSSGNIQYMIASKTRDPRLMPIKNEWDMTDQEWSLIAPIASYRSVADRPGRPSGYALRDVVNGAILKMGTGIAWSEVWNQRKGFSASPMLYRRMKADGRWDQIVEVLASSRQKTSLHCSS
ncbi:transposase [Paraburkholderia sp. RL17-347-BIC-D]|uniref:transposase n=1 Tax=Paraburkholderia sp. RL17-347-BIC-D TaxID=3031632 RepID=UPI0038B73BC0